MIIDHLSRADVYADIHKGFKTAFQYLNTTDLKALPAGRYAIAGDNVFALVQEYDTMDTANEQMEAHKKYIDIQYMISGEEQVGHALYAGQEPSKAYEAETDFMLYGDAPSFFTRMATGTFMIFFPTDLHMPCIQVGAPAKVKKVVIKVAIAL